MVVALQPLSKLMAVRLSLRQLHLVSSESELKFQPFEVSLTEDKPYCCVIGPSGSGKTTFFKSLIPRFVDDWTALSEVHMEQEFSINGLPFDETNCRIGYAAQHPYFISHRTVVDNLTQPFRWKGLTTPSGATISDLLKDFHLSEVANRRAYQLSAGERQRLNLARMFLASPQVAIIDECFSPMDEDLAEDIAELISERYQRSMRIFVTGHRMKDLAPFRSRAQALCFSFADASDGPRPVRNVTVKVEA